MGIFIITLIALFSFQFRNEVLSDLEEHNIAKIDISDFVMYQISQDVTDVIIHGAHATQYKDKDVFLDVSLSRSLGKQGIEVASGSVVNHTKKKYSFPSGVHYERSDGLKFFSENGVLDTIKEVFNGEGKFRLETKEGSIIGENLIYHNRDQDFYARNIKGRYLISED